MFSYQFSSFFSFKDITRSSINSISLGSVIIWICFFVPFILGQIHAFIEKSLLSFRWNSSCLSLSLGFNALRSLIFPIWQCNQTQRCKRSKLQKCRSSQMTTFNLFHSIFDFVTSYDKAKWNVIFQHRPCHHN